MTEKGIWTSILTFADTEPNGAPLVYESDEHIPMFDDPKGGCLDVAQIDVDAPDVPGEIASVRIGVVDKNGSATIVIDGYHAAILVNTLRGWLDREVPLG